jgi:hypothetical protein
MNAKAYHQPHNVLQENPTSLITGTPKLRIAFFSAETEHCRVGGLGEVASALPAALQKKGISITRFTPLHSPVWRAAGKRFRRVAP